MKTNLNFKTIIAALAITLGLSSCMKNDENYTPVEISGISLINASPTADKLDVYIDNTRASVNDFVFGTKMDYLNAYTGTRTFRVAKSGATTAFYSKDFKLEPSVGYSAFLINKTDNLEILMLADELKVPATGKAHVRFVNVSPDATALSLSITGQTTSLATAIAYKASSTFVEINAAEKVSFDIKTADGVTSSPLQNVKIEAGKIYTVWAKGLVAATDDTKFGVAIFTHK
ncbi:MAG: DUF4397 domain-containing protein [Flavobacterium sp.]|nr:MAG: DUF4397 domain-containing protein [Flavobacterium sp.]